jgi:hypothetical protein
MYRLKNAQFFKIHPILANGKSHQIKVFPHVQGFHSTKFGRWESYGKNFLNKLRLILVDFYWENFENELIFDDCFVMKKPKTHSPGGGPALGNAEFC